jgi:hypothetical protein
MITLEFVRTYLDDLLAITKADLCDHLDKLKLVLTRLRAAGLKVNADKSKFCAHETEYLGYILTRDGIKPQTNKIEAILAINPPTNVKELRRFLGMVQYYRDMWMRRSEMLAPLTDLSSTLKTYAIHTVSSVSQPALKPSSKCNTGTDSTSLNDYDPNF